MAIIILPIMVIGHLFLGSYYPISTVENIAQENLWELDFHLLPHVLSQILVFVFICGNAFLLNFVFNRLEFNNRYIYLPTVLYVLLLFLFPFSLYFNEYLIVHTFFILSFYHLLQINQNDDARNNLFLSGLFLGVATTFSPPVAIFLVIILLSLFSIRPFSLREHLLPLTGFVFPFLWVHFVNFDWWRDLLVFTPDNELIISNSLVLVGYITVALFILLSIKVILEERAISSVVFKRISSITLFTVIVFLGLAILMAIVHDTSIYFVLSTATLPFILPYPYIIVKKRKWFANTLFYLLLILNICKFFYT